MFVHVSDETAFKTQLTDRLKLRGPWRHSVGELEKLLRAHHAGKGSEEQKRSGLTFQDVTATCSVSSSVPAEGNELWHPSLAQLPSSPSPEVDI